MKKLIFLLLFTPLTINAQDKKASFPNSSWFHQNILLGEEGFLLHDINSATLFDLETNLLWKVETETPRGYYLNSHNVLVASPSASTFFHVQIYNVRDGFNKKPHYITQVTRDGKSKSVQIQGSLEFGKSLQAVFCDDKYLYYLTTANGNEMKKGFKSKEKMILNRFEKDTFTATKIVLDLPALIESEDITFWTFIGQNAEEKFLLSKKINKKSGHLSATVVSFNQQGEILREFSLNADLEGKFLRPAYSPVENKLNLFYNSTPGRPFANVINLDYKFYTKEGYGSHGFHLTGSGGFVTPYYDERSNTFYLFGLYGSKPFTSVASVYEGFYVKRFDASGKLIMSYQSEVPKKLLGEDYFTMHASPGSRRITLKPLGNGTLNFSLLWNSVTGGKYIFALSADGSALGYLDCEGLQSNNRSVIYAGTGNPVKSAEYVIANQLDKGKNISYEYFFIPSGELLLINDTKKKNMDILLFKSNN